MNELNNIYFKNLISVFFFNFQPKYNILKWKKRGDVFEYVSSVRTLIIQIKRVKTIISSINYNKKYRYNLFEIVTLLFAIQLSKLLGRIKNNLTKKTE